MRGIGKKFNRLWNSPTFTAWGSYAVESLRLVAVTPLLLNRFSTAEIAIWYLFGSLVFLSNLIGARMGPMYARMIAFAMGGADSLAPIKGNVVPGGSGKPNWELLQRAYSTLGALNLGLGSAALLVAFMIGYFPLVSLVSELENPQHAWWAFAIMLGSGFINQIFQGFTIALRGMNYVALVNRWNMVFALFSTLCGFIALSLNANLWQLALVMQGVQLLNIGRFALTLFLVENGRFRKFPIFQWDKKVFLWSWPPFWRIMTLSFSGAGLLQLGAAVYTKSVSAAEAAAFLLTLRLILSIRRISDAPYESHVPRMSKFLAMGEVAKLRQTVQGKIRLQQALFPLGVLALALIGPFALKLVSSNAELLPTGKILLFGLLYQAQYYLVVHLMVAQLGNHIILFVRQAAVGGVSFGLIYLLVPQYPFYGLLIAVFAAFLAVINIAPIRYTIKRLETSAKVHCLATAGPAAAVWLLNGAILTALSYY